MDEMTKTGHARSHVLTHCHVPRHRACQSGEIVLLHFVRLLVLRKRLCDGIRKRCVAK
ncbi:MAG: hypothetical protein IJV98_09155 [Clostridia bacterium]|nr:hypothetical protein [Clostridia bacterium]